MKRMKLKYNMKKYLLTLILAVTVSLNGFGQGWYSENDNYQGASLSANASLTIQNRSSYTLIVKIMRTGGRGLYQTLNISPNSSGYVTFSKSDTFYTKTKASKGFETLYKKTGTFSIQCDETGYSQATLEFFVSSGHGGTGQGISKAEFESNK